MASEVQRFSGPANPLAAPAPGTAAACTELGNNVAELIKYGIRDEMDYQQAAGMLKNIKHNYKKTEEIEESEKRPLLDDLDKIREKWKPLKLRWKKAEDDIKALIVKFDEDQQKKRREAQQLLEQEAAKARDRLQARADKALAKGSVEQASALIEQAQAVVAQVVQSEVPKVEGMHFTTEWDFEVIDAALVPAEYKKVDLVALRKVVKALKESAKSIPGIRVWDKKGVSSTSKQPEI